MTPIFLKSLSHDQYIEHQFLSPRDHHTENQFLSPNSQASSSSDSLTCHLFLNSSTTTHDQDGAFNRESHPSQLDEDDNFGSQACEDHHVESHDERGISGLKFSLWKNESYDHTNDENQVKWMSSKMRVMYRMRKTNPMKVNTLQPATGEPPNKLEDHKEPTSSSSPMGETANSNSINSTSYNIPVRSCSDCNTTKTPLWRSGPQGPKSLCNACGIRQRKARKAMALAAAAAAETSSSKNVFSDKPTSLKATKILHKHHKKTNNGHTTKLKKTQYSKQIHKTNHHQLPSSSCSSPARKNRVEDFLVSLRKNLPFHGVFPHDEKEAAILLMALSCGYAPR